ncbi:MAG: acyl-CoA synthetase [Nitrospiraceae bacterium]|jgi:acetate---CoA ligase (ADP-forming) subunit beta|nr:MAG: acyl-CoA synthetase [Nitrospiraceae bacterium]
MLKQFIEKAQGRTTFLEHEVKGLLKDMGFSVPKGRFIRAGERLPEDLGLVYPLIAKVSSQKISSKSDVHGLRAGLRNESELGSAVEELSHIEHAEGVLVEEMAPRGVEVIVGGVHDRQFGPVMMFGLGGIFVEIFKDVSFGLAPLSRDDALWMIDEVKGKKLLEGYRGSVPVDREALEELLISVSGIMATGLIGEIDLNPVVLYPEGAMVLDAKMKLHLS